MCPVEVSCTEPGFWEVPETIILLSSRLLLSLWQDSSNTHSNSLYPHSLARAVPHLFLTSSQRHCRIQPDKQAFTLSLPPAHTASPGLLPVQPLLCWGMEAPANEAAWKNATMPLDRHHLSSGLSHVGYCLEEGTVAHGLCPPGFLPTL